VDKRLVETTRIIKNQTWGLKDSKKEEALTRLEMMGYSVGIDYTGGADHSVATIALKTDSGQMIAYTMLYSELYSDFALERIVYNLNELIRKTL